MISKVAFRFALTASLLSICWPATGQDTGKAKQPPSINLDAGPADGATPDPLAPPEAKGPPPAAPGSPAARSTETEQVPSSEADPIAAQILVRLGEAAPKSEAREDVSGLTAFYTENKGRPVWTTKDGFNAQAMKAVKEIRSADEWGLDAAAFRLPASPVAGATPEALADAELKLSLAILKYARFARGGRIDPPSLSPIIDRRPRVYEPRSVLAAIAAAESADAYLRGLHPKHEQFKRLKRALLSLGKGGNPGPSARIPSGPDLRPGEDHPQISFIRRRLGAAADGADTLYDTALRPSKGFGAEGVRYDLEGRFPVCAYRFAPEHLLAGHRSGHRESQTAAEH